MTQRPPLTREDVRKAMGRPTDPRALHLDNLLMETQLFRRIDQETKAVLAAETDLRLACELAGVDPAPYRSRAREDAITTAIPLAESLRRMAVAVRAAAHAAAYERLRWHRFDTLYGPLIGAAVILGTLVLAGVAAWLQ